MAALSDADYKPCPHCGARLHKWGRAKHIRVCPKRPAIAQQMRAVMTGVDGCAVGTREYSQRVRGTGLPSHVALCRMFHSWAAACAWFGVTPPNEARANACPHCGRTCAPANLRVHVRKCVRRPDIAAALRVALTSPEDGCLASRREYDEQRGALPISSTLARQFGDWQALATAFDLPLRSAAAGIRRGHASRRAWRRDEWRRTPQVDPLLVGAVRVRDDYGEFDGLPVAGVRSLDGGGTAYMLR